MSKLSKELIRQITTPKKEDNSRAHKSFERFLKQQLGDSYEKYKEKENTDYRHSTCDGFSLLYTFFAV